MLSCLSVRNTLCVEFQSLTSEEAIKLGVGTVTDVRGVIMTAPKIDIVRSAGADTSKDGELILGTSTNTTETSHTEKTTTAGVWQAQSGHGSTTQTANQSVINGVMSKCPQHFLRWISTPVFSKISLSGLVFDEVVALVGAALCLLFVQNLTRTQALPLADADSAVGVGLKSGSDWSTS